jgi:hypothetical protein
VESLTDYAKNDSVSTGYTAWRDKSPENQKMWREAVDGYKNGIMPSVIIRWLRDEKGCPLTDNTLRNQLKDAVNHG